VPIWKK